MLTAAHCIHEGIFEHDQEIHDQGKIKLPIVSNEFILDIKSTISVYIGLHNINEKTSSRRVLVKNFVKYPENSSFLHDIALIKIDEFLRSNSRVGFACLPHGNDDKYPGEHKESVVIGWGKTNENDKVSDVINNVAINILPQMLDCGRMPFHICKFYWELYNLHFDPSSY